MKPQIIATVIIAIISQTSANFECIGTCYSGQVLPETKDISRGRHLKGFSYKNITTNDPKKCYSSCIQDCRCKSCQMKDARCELLDEDKTSKADNFTSGPGYVYYDLQQTMFQGKSHMVSIGTCYNGCCKTKYCMNGGTCIEHCETPKKKFSCKCKDKFYGKVCEQEKYSSCLDVLKSSSSTPNNGLYTIHREDTDETKLFYCAFNSPNEAWTLLESFSRSANSFQKVTFGQAYAGVYSNPLMWDKYRLSHADIQYARSKAKMFRCTCNFPERVADYDSRDYLLGDLDKFDITAEITISGICKPFVYMNVRGHSYNNTGFSVWQMSGNYHFHIDVTVSFCGYNVPDAVASEDVFGYYGNFNPKFLCTQSDASTTQWWVGDTL